MDASSQRKLGVILGYVNTVVQTVVSFVYTPLLLIGIGQSEYGLYQIIGSLTAYINILESMLTTSILRFYCQAKAEDDEVGMENVLAIARLVYGIASLVVIALAVAFAFFFVGAYSSGMTEGEVHEGVVMLFVVCANIVLNMTFFTYSTVVQANERFVFIKVLELVGLILQPVAVLALVMAFPQALVISIVQLVVSAITCVLKRQYAVCKLGCRIVAHDVCLKTVMPIVGFSGVMLVSMIADIIFAKTGQLIVGYVIDMAAVAVYSVGYQIYQAYGVLGRMVSSVFVPRVTEITKHPNSEKELSLLWNKTGRFSMLILAGILGGFALYGQEFIRLWVGDGYEEAFTVALLMMFAFVPDIVQALGLTILQVLNRYNFRSGIYVACALLNAVLAFPLIDKFGVSGGAFGGLLVLFVGSGVVMNIYYSRAIGLDVGGFWRSVAASLKGLPIAVLVGLCANLIQMPSSTLTFLVHCLIFTAAYALSAYSVSMNRYEKNLLQGLILNRKRADFRK